MSERDRPPFAPGSGAVIPKDRVVVGMRLPIQAGASSFAEPWESEASQRTLETIVRKADEAGMFYLAVNDHIGIPRDDVATMGAVWYEPIATLAWAAAMTQRVRLLADDYVLALRHPLAASKAFLTLDTLSHGRAIFGLSPGVLEKEFELLGVPFARREQLLADGIAVLRETFVSECPEIATTSWSVGSLAVAPRPAQTPPPIWISGSSKKALQRAAEIGDGWLPAEPGREALKEQVALLRAYRRDVGGTERMDIGALAEPIYLGKPSWDVGAETLQGSAEVVAGGLLSLAELGANHIRVSFRSRSADELLAQLEVFGAEVVPLLDPDGQRSAKYEEPPFQEIARMSRLQAQAMETSDDERLWGAIGNDMLLLTTKGRRSGREHKVPLAFWRDKEGRPILVGSYAGAPMHPDWYLNLADRAANPLVSVRTRDRAFLAKAVELEGHEYAEIWSQLTLDRPSYRNYSTRTDRRFALIRLIETS